jgi:hypothetical protein
MSLAEIEALLPDLSEYDLAHLQLRIAEIRARRGEIPLSIPSKTISAMAHWSETRERLPDDEAEAFARDIEEAHRLMNVPIEFKEWEK